MIDSDILIVVPCYNEEKRLPVRPFLDFARLQKHYHFLFVDDGSSDHTFGLLEQMCKENPAQMDVLKLEKNGGKAEAVRQGFLKALGTQAWYIGFWDADLATPLYVLPEFIQAYHEKPSLEMIFGSRVRLMGHRVERKMLRHYLGRIFATMASNVIKLSIYDTQCGAKIFRKTPVLAEIFKTPFKSKWIFDVEILARYLQIKRREGLKDFDELILELPLPEWRDVGASKVRPGDFLKAFSELLQICLTYRQ